MKPLILIHTILILTSCIKMEQADLVVRNAKIYTIDSQFTIAKAMAIKDGKVLEVGDEHQILNKYRANQTLDVKGRVIYPGFIDAHCHFLGYGLSLQQVNLTGTSSFDEVIEKVVAFSKSNKSNWITGRGWDQNDWKHKEFPTKNKLDSLFPNTPVLIKRIDGHAALANQAALEQANITTQTTIEGGIIEIKGGTPTGILIDNAIKLVSQVIPKNNESQKATALLDAQKRCFQVGLTTVDDAGLDKDEIELIDKLHQSKQLKMKIYAMLSDNIENFNHYLEKGPYKTQMLSVRAFKFYADGALGSRGAALIQPYSDITDSTHYGLILNTTNYFTKYAQQLYDKGFQMNTHCIGDSANRLILDIYANVLKGTNDKRWRIEHCQVIAPNDYPKFKEFNVIPSVQPTHATSDMDWAIDRLGEQRIKDAYAWEKLKQQNGMLALGTDFPIEDINPLNTFYAAVFRKNRNGNPELGFQMENAISRMDAIKGMTIGAAIANFEEKEKGSLEPGKAADFIVLSNDILKCSEKDVLNTKVLYTYINGEEVYPVMP